MQLAIEIIIPHKINLTLDGSYLHHQSEREIKYFIEMEMDIFPSFSRIPNINFTIVTYRISLKIQILIKFHRILRKGRREKYHDRENYLPPESTNSRVTVIDVPKGIRR